MNIEFGRPLLGGYAFRIQKTMSYELNDDQKIAFESDLLKLFIIADALPILKGRVCNHVIYNHCNIT